MTTPQNQSNEGNPNPNPNPNPGDGNQNPNPGEGNSNPAGKVQVLDSSKGDSTPTATWPDDWRQQVAAAQSTDAKEQAAIVKRLERMGSPSDLGKSYLSLDKKISSGDFRAALPKDASPEQVSEWRKANGVPESADKYEVKLKDGFVFGKADEPYVEQYKKYAHERNIPADVVNANLEFFLQNRQEQIAGREVLWAEQKQKTEDTLNKEWGGDYRGNVTRINVLIGNMSDTTNELLASALGADGLPLLNNPSFLNDLLNLAREINPSGTVLPGTSGQQMESVDAEIKTLEAKMGTNDWYKDEKSQARYQELLNWQIKNGHRK